MDTLFLGTIGSDENSTPWMVDVKLNGSVVNFKIDTGADVTVVPNGSIDSSLVTLRKADKILYGPGGKHLHVCGMFRGTLSFRDRNIDQEIYVVEGLKHSLLGRPAIEKLELLLRINSVQSVTDVRTRYPELFEGLGKLAGEYTIKLREDAHPVALTTPRRVPIPLLPKVKTELARMEQLGVIEKIDEPSEWCSGMVVVQKPKGGVRICVDLTQLNESVQREIHPMPAVDITLGQLAGAKFFSRLDANSGFWQVQLSEDSAKLTTFITPFGRYFFRRLPFGISSAPEYFQKQMSRILEGQKGVVCQTDDVLVHGSTKIEHDTVLDAVLQKLKGAGVTLNAEKCEFFQTETNFLGHIVNENGIRPDPNKVKAILEMSPPTDVSGVRRLLGMVNQLGKFSENLAQTTKPIRDLLSKQNCFVWGVDQQNAFTATKSILTSTPILALYDPQKKTVISADSSSFGLGAVLSQIQNNGERRPVAYASRSLTTTEMRYAQVEKEALASTWACERFSDFLIGSKFLLETDHKPLVSLLGTKSLCDLPPRVQRFRMRLMRFTYDVIHIPGKELNTPDALSRAPISEGGRDTKKQELETDAYVSSVVQSLPATRNCLDRIRDELKNDSVCAELIRYISTEWPQEKSQVSDSVRPYWNLRGELTVNEELLMKGCRLVIPVKLQGEFLEKLHEGHLGITKCRERAKISIWWPGLSTQIKELVSNCYKCAENRNDSAEPLLPTTLPDRPWKRVGTDLFFYKQQTYLLVVDYYSRFIEIAKLDSTSSLEVITHLKSIFSRHGVPEEVISDNGPQYASEYFRTFARNYGFIHTTSSPRYPQSNGEAERAVQTVKQLLKKNTDPYKALMIYRATPLKNGYSPAELCMGRMIRTNLPMTSDILTPKWPNVKIVQERESEFQRTQKVNFDKRHRAKDVKPLLTGDRVLLKDMGIRGTVVEPAATPRSYIVRTDRGYLRRNSRHLIHTKGPLVPDTPEVLVQKEITEPQPTVSTDVSSRNTTLPTQGRMMTRSGRISVPPQRLDL